MLGISDQNNHGGTLDECKHEAYAIHVADFGNGYLRAACTCTVCGDIGVDTLNSNNSTTAYVFEEN